METEGSLSPSYQSTNGPHPELFQSSLHTHCLSHVRRTCALKRGFAGLINMPHAKQFDYKKCVALKM
jgi:hypothetical protein